MRFYVPVIINELQELHVSLWMDLKNLMSVKNQGHDYIQYDTMYKTFENMQSRITYR